jgi:hypothetical protein
MHHDQSCAGRREFGIDFFVRKPLNIVQEVRVLTYCPALNAQRKTVDRERTLLRFHRTHDRHQPRNFDFRIDRLCFGVGRGCAEVENVRAAFEQIARMRERRVGCEKSSPVGEGVLRDIDDAEKLRCYAHRPG